MLVNSTGCGCPPGLLKTGDNCRCPEGFALSAAAECQGTKVLVLLKPNLTSTRSTAESPVL